MPRVFAAGDCTDTADEKTAFSADLAAALAAQNITRMSEGKTDLLTFPESSTLGPVPEVADVSLYKFDGVLQVKSLVITGIPAAISKALVEAMQLMLAKEWKVAIYLWGWIEFFMLRACSWI